MADESEQEQRTEQPSDRRLQQAFDNGDIAMSRDAMAAAGLTLGFATLFGLASSMQDRLGKTMAEIVTLLPQAPFHTLPGLLFTLAAPVGLVLFTAGLGAFALGLAQTRGVLWSEKASPDLSRLFEPQRLTRFASWDFALDLVVSVAKVAAISWAAWKVLKGELASLALLQHAPVDAQLRGLFHPLSRVFTFGVVLVIGFAALDWGLTRRRYLKRHMMTKEELKREMKEDEGDPLLRGARKRKHRELVKRNALAETKRADVILVNPTHIAIALRYRKDEGKAPRVLAKGKGVLAEAMRQAARENGVPIVQDIPLARLLYRKVKAGGQVPADTYKAVAAVLAFVYRVTGRTPGRPSEVRS